MRRDPSKPETSSAWLLLALALIVLLAQITAGFSQGPNNRNVSVDARVNVTGSAPEVTRVQLVSPIALVAGSITTVACNATVRDFNGFGDIQAVNATLFRANHTLAETDDNNTHYTNGSCAVVAGQQSGAFANYTCTFGVTYYAVNGTWNCTIMANDTINLQGLNSNLTSVSTLLALNVTALINYGDMAMGDTSSDQEANVTNLGNYPINVTVRGYGATLDDGYSFVCEQGTIPVGREKFAANSTATYAQKQNLTSSYSQIAALTIRKAVNGTLQLNTTYWQLFLDPSENVFGLCNGTIIFQAEAS